MRLDPRLPWLVLVDYVWSEWEHGFLGVWARREVPTGWTCECSEWQSRYPEISHLAHWQVHGLITRISEVRADLERHLAYEIVKRDGAGAVREARAVVPDLDDEQRGELDEKLIHFDRLAEGRVPSLPEQVARLLTRCRQERDLRVARLESLDQILERMIGGFPPSLDGADLVSSPRGPRSHDGDRGRAEAAVRRLYGHLGLEDPTIFWARSPKQAERICEVVADVCLAATAETAGIPELEIELAWTHRKHVLDECAEESLRAAIARIFTRASPASALAPITGRMNELSALAELRLARRLGREVSELGAILRSESQEQQEAWARRRSLLTGVEIALDAEFSPGGMRAIATDAGAADALDLLEQRAPGDLRGVAEVLTLRREVFSWSGARGVVVLIEPPVEERVDAAGRLHCEDGAAVRWQDGWELYFWRGMPAPADLVLEGWGAERILAEGNVEVRRCGIERLGWENFVRAAGLRRIGAPAPDPGNPGHELELYALPPALLNRAGVNILLCTNASDERDGTRRRYGLMVPAGLSDPVEAAAWTFGVPRSDYAELRVAT